MSRSAARARVSVAELERQAKGVWFDQRIAHRLVDEAPAAYKDITKVMRAQRALTCIQRRLEPVLSYKGTQVWVIRRKRKSYSVSCWVWAMNSSRYSCGSGTPRGNGTVRGSWGTPRTRNS